MCTLFFQQVYGFIAIGNNDARIGFAGNSVPFGTTGDGTYLYWNISCCKCVENGSEQSDRIASVLVDIKTRMSALQTRDAELESVTRTGFCVDCFAGGFSGQRIRFRT